MPYTKFSDLFCVLLIISNKIHLFSQIANEKIGIVATDPELTFQIVLPFAHVRKRFWQPELRQYFLGLPCPNR